MRGMLMGEKIKSWIDAKGLDQMDLVRGVNAILPPGEKPLTKQTLNALILRNSKGSKFAPYLARVMEVELDSLVTPGAPLRHLREAEKISAANELARSGARPTGYNRATVPVITMREAAEMCIAGELATTGHSEVSVGFLDAPPGPGSFAVVLENDSMEAPSGLSFPAGTVIVLDPNRQPRNGDFVLVCDTSTSTMLRRLVVDGAKRYLTPLNPRYPVLEWQESFIIAGTACGYHGRL